MCTCCAGPGPCLTVAAEPEEIPTVWEVDCTKPGMAVHREQTPAEAEATRRIQEGRAAVEQLFAEKAARRQRALERLRTAAETSESARDLLTLLER